MAFPQKDLLDTIIIKKYSTFTESSTDDLNRIDPNVMLRTMNNAGIVALSMHAMTTQVSKSCSKLNARMARYNVTRPAFA